MLQLLFEVIGEFLLQVIIQILVEIGLRSLAEPFRISPNPWIAAIGYALFGAIVGAISLFVFPSHLVPVKSWQIINLLLTPVAVGICMMALGLWRAKRGQFVLRIDRFSYGYLFALGVAVVRFGFAK